MKSSLDPFRLLRSVSAFLCIVTLAVPRTALPCAGSSSIVCVVNSAACLTSMSVAKSVTNVVVFPPGGPALVNVGFTLNITCPRTNNCGNACPNPGGPVSASLTVDLYPGPPCPPVPPLPAPTASTTLSTAAGSMALPTFAPLGPMASIYNVGLTVPAGTAPGLYCVVGTATVTFSNGMVLTQTGDTVVCLVEPAPDQPGVPRLGLELLTEGNVFMAPGDQTVARYRVTNNDKENAVELSAVATSKQTAVRPQGDNELNGVFAISNPFGDDYPIVFDPGLGCIPLPAHPYIQAPIRQVLPLLAPGESRVISVGIRSYGQCADGSCSESTLRIEGTFEDGDPALACAGISLIVDTSIPSQNCGSSVNDCNQNGIPDALDIASRQSSDLNFNAMPDECEEVVSAPISAGVNPIDPLPGQPIQVQVAFNEVIPMANVWADGHPLIRTQFLGAPFWIGTIPADTRPGPQTVYFLGIDEIQGASTFLAIYEVQAASPEIIEQPQDVTVVQGQDATFQVVAEGTEPLVFQWYRDGVTIPGADESILVLSDVQPTDAGGYSVVVASGTAAVESDIAQLIVELPPPVFEFTALEPTLESMGGDLYGLVPQVGIRVGSAATDPVPLDFEILVNGTLRFDGRGAHGVAGPVLCEGPGCGGACTLLIDGEAVPGTCMEVGPDCFCNANTFLDAAVLNLMPGDTVEIVFDPDNLVVEPDESDNTITLIVPELPMPRHDYRALEPSLVLVGESLYELTPHVALTVAADTTDVLPLDFTVYVNDILRYDGRGETSVSMRSMCEDEANCKGGCFVSVGGRRVQGTCSGTAPGCGCDVSAGLTAIMMTLAPDDIVRLELDPDHLVLELDESNNVFSITVPEPPVIQYDFSAEELSLTAIDDGLYELELRVGIVLGANATSGVSLDYVVLVNGEVAHDGRGEYTVGSPVACENPSDCSGGCAASVNGETVLGDCFAGTEGCDCKVKADLDAVELMAFPGDVIQVVFDPDGVVPEFNEGNNSATTAVNYERPRLSIEYAGVDVVVSWDGAAVNQILQIAQELTEPVLWVNEQREPETVGDRFQLSYPPDISARFFRLAPIHLAAPNPLTVSGAIDTLRQDLVALLAREPELPVRTQMGESALGVVDALMAKDQAAAYEALEGLVAYVEGTASSSLSRAVFSDLVFHISSSLNAGALVGFVSNDTDQDKITNLADDDIDGDGWKNGDIREDDIDGDGKRNDVDDDMDGDGAANGCDTDMDNDGKLNSDDDDIDADGKSNQGPARKTRPGGGDEADDDIDGDGISDDKDFDIDGDGCLNSVDPDMDGDGLPNDDPNEDDIDGDGVINGGDKEPSGNTKPAPPGGQAPDRDGDGIPDGMDDDVDGDGKLNKADSDVDGDGMANGMDDDVDGDGKGNSVDDDVDGDGSINGADLDVDGDGVTNADDRDIDGDGIPNDQDPDMDGDGVANEADDDMDGDDLRNGETDPDIDGDGTTNDVDGDVDGDGTSNAMDDDVDGDGIVNDEDADDDGDGIQDQFDSTPQGL